MLPDPSLGVSYKTAWYLCHRIREAMGNDPFTGPTLLASRPGSTGPPGKWKDSAVRTACHAYDM